MLALTFTDTGFIPPYYGEDARKLAKLVPDDRKKDLDIMLRTFRDQSTLWFDPEIEYNRNKSIKDSNLPEEVLLWFRDRNGMRGEGRLMCKFITDQMSIIEKEFSIKVDTKVICGITEKIGVFYERLLTRAYNTRNEKDPRKIQEIWDYLYYMFAELCALILILLNYMVQIKTPNVFRMLISAKLVQAHELQQKRMQLYYEYYYNSLFMQRQQNSPHNNG